MSRINIGGISVDNVSMDEAIGRIESLIAARTPSMVVTPNIDHIVKLQSDQEFRRIYERSALVLADGMPLVWASHFLGTPLKGRVTGSDLFPLLAGVAAQKNYRVFLLGGREGAAEQAAKVLSRRYPGFQAVGLYSPPMGFEKNDAENQKIIQMVRVVSPDILFVGLGAPKQEKWTDKYLNELNVPVSIGVGVSFELTAGLVKRAPVWMQRVGLEWFWRLIMEPSRLWRRYLVDDPEFFWLIAKQRFSKPKVP